MFGYTHQLRVNAEGLNARLMGYTIEKFKSQYVDPQIGNKDDPYGLYVNYLRRMNNDLMDLNQPVVQQALVKSVVYARDAANKAAEYFEKRPGRVKSYSRQQKIFLRHFKLNNPTAIQRDEVERVLKATAKGLNGAIVISDLFAAKDGQRDRGLVDGAEGQVGFNEVDDALYMQDLIAAADEERTDVTRTHLSTATDAQIYLNFGLMKFNNLAELARIIVHEATHKYAYTGDYAYYSNGHQFSQMLGTEAIKNADSYAYAAISVKESSTLTPEKIKRLGESLLSLQDLQRVVPSMRA